MSKLLNGFSPQFYAEDYWGLRTHGFIESSVSWTGIWFGQQENVSSRSVKPDKHNKLINEDFV
jgi:hypothetical protein